LQNYAESDDYYQLKNISINFAVANSTVTTVTLPHIPGTFTNLTILANTTMDPKCTTDSGNNCGNPVGVPTMELQTMAVECSLFPCARTYTAAVVNGAIVETEVKRSVGQGDWLENQGSWRGGLLPGDVRIDPNENCPSDWPYRNGSPPPCTYTAGALPIMALGNFFWGFWNGSVAGRTYGGAASNNNVLDILYGRGVTNFSQIDHVLGGIADSMTAAIRLTGRVDYRDPDWGSGQAPVTGQVMLADTCIDVRSGWFAMPAVVAILTLLLLIAAIVHGGGSGATADRPAWKSSALAVLFHGLDAEHVAARGRLLSATEMEREASGLWVRLTDETSGILRLEPCSRQGVDDGQGS